METALSNLKSMQSQLLSALGGSTASQASG